MFQDQWKRASMTVAKSKGKSKWHSRKLRQWCRNFIDDPRNLPRRNYGRAKSAIHSDEDLRLEIITHLQGIGRYFSANDLLNYVNQPAILERLHVERGLTLRTAQNWLKLFSFRWRAEAQGMYTDGHEREDVVKYRQEVFLPKYLDLNLRAAQYDDDGNELPRDLPQSGGKQVVFHHHDETVYYGNDRRSLRWVLNSESPRPHAKGEGQSVMIADFVSSAFGWLSSPDGTKRARVTLRPGKGRDGYFCSDDVVNQLTTATDILDNHYKGHEHVFVLDNAKTHTKRSESALSARRLPKNPSASFATVAVIRGSNGKPVLDENGAPKTERQPMHDGTFADGSRQCFYYPPDHPQYPSHFKGMTQLLRERGFNAPEKLRTECPKFKCNPGAQNCCQRRILFNEADFANVPSLVEQHCWARGYSVIFLPKFHPELNFVEMCWGYGKRCYRELPAAPKIEQVERSAIWSLEQVPLTSMRRYANDNVYGLPTNKCAQVCEQGPAVYGRIQPRSKR
jgi:hypothetical protein